MPGRKRKYPSWYGRVFSGGSGLVGRSLARRTLPSEAVARNRLRAFAAGPLKSWLYRPGSLAYHRGKRDFYSRAYFQKFSK